jgi:hypothetical protein
MEFIMAFFVVLAFFVAFFGLNVSLYIYPTRLGFAQKWAKPNLVYLTITAIAVIIFTVFKTEMFENWWDVVVDMVFATALIVALMTSHVWQK